MLKEDRNEAAYIIGEVTPRLIMGIMNVQVYWRYSLRAFSMAETHLVKEDVEMMGQLLNEKWSDKYFPNREELLAADSYQQIATQNSLQHQKLVIAGIAGSALVFAHAILEAAIVDILKIAMLACPQDWIPMVKEKKVKIDQVMPSPDSIVQTMIVDYWRGLERAPLMTKVERLHQIVRPAPTPLQNYKYDPDRLKRLDDRRHEVTHHDRHAYDADELDGDLTFLWHTGFYLLNLTMVKYGLRALARPPGVASAPK